MLIVERQQRLLDILRDRKAAELEELARVLGVSTSTVRRDLEALEGKGLVQRTHGGAILVETAGEANGSAVRQPSIVLAERMGQQVEAKQAIGRYAAGLVQPHMTVILDGGSTVVYAAQLIRARPLQIVTNSLSIANLFNDDEQVELLIVGGSLYPRTGVMVGPIATGCLADFHADLTLFSLAGIYDDAAFNINLAMAQVEQVMLRQAARSVLLMDAGKFGRKSLVRVCGLGEVDAIVTDAAVDRVWKERIGDRLVVADDS
jgi:DeoR/GlpR family transcriptional regulator of sugar metabolism